jgi:hypothetical protein
MHLEKSEFESKTGSCMCVVYYKSIHFLTPSLIVHEAIAGDLGGCRDLLVVK